MLNRVLRHLSWRPIPFSLSVCKAPWDMLLGKLALASLFLIFLLSIVRFSASRKLIGSYRLWFILFPRQHFFKIIHLYYTWSRFQMIICTANECCIVLFLKGLDALPPGKQKAIYSHTWRQVPGFLSQRPSTNGTSEAIRLNRHSWIGTAIDM